MIKDLIKAILKKIKDYYYLIKDNYFMTELKNIIITKSVIEQIIISAINNHPKEFILLLSGYYKNKELIINELFYEQFFNTKNSASINGFLLNNLPPGKKILGTVHNHPSGNAKPSIQDKLFFNKKGIVHIIIGYPYNINNIRFYNKYGEEIMITLE